MDDEILSIVILYTSSMNHETGVTTLRLTYAVNNSVVNNQSVLQRYTAKLELYF